MFSTRGRPQQLERINSSKRTGVGTAVVKRVREEAKVDVNLRYTLGTTATELPSSETRAEATLESSIFEISILESEVTLFPLTP